MVLAKDLRDAVLQAALQGKLTEQLETDSSVDKMLAIIEKEKKRLIGEHNKVVTPIEENIPFEIPNSWRWIRLFQIGEIIGGGTPKTIEPSYWDKGTIPWITPADMNGCGLYIGTGNKYITENGLNNSSAQLIPKGSVIISSRAPIGYISIAKNNLTTSQGCKSFSAHNKRLIDSKYIYYLMINRTEDMINRATGTTFKEISGKGVGETIIPLPPIEEQQRIAIKVSELMGKIDEYEKVENELAAFEKKFPSDMKNALLQAGMQGKLTKQLETDSSVDEMLATIEKEKKQLIKEKKVKKEKINDITDDDILFDIPKNWRWVRLGNIVNLRIGKTPPRAELEHWGNDYPWVSIADMVADGHILATKERISEFGFKNKFGCEIVHPGTLIMSFKLTIGRVSILDIDAVHNEAIVSIFPYNDTNNFLRNYLFKVLTFLSKYGDSKNAIKGNTLNSKSLNNLLIPLPPNEEQQRIVKTLEKLRPLCEAL